MSKQLHGGPIAHAEAIKEATRRLRHDPVRHSVGVLVMALMLALPGVAWVALRGLDVMLPVEITTPGLSVFVRQDISESDLTALADNLLMRDEVLTVEVVGRNQGLEALSQLAGLGDLVGAFESNPLPDVVRLAIDALPQSEAMQALSLALGAIREWILYELIRDSVTRCVTPWCLVSGWYWCWRLWCWRPSFWWSLGRRASR